MNYHSINLLTPVEGALRTILESLHLSSEHLSRFGETLFALARYSEGATPQPPSIRQELTVKMPSDLCDLQVSQELVFRLPCRSEVRVMNKLSNVKDERCRAKKL